MKLKGLKEERAKAVTAMRTLADKVAERGSSMTDEERAEDKRISADLESISERIGLEERATQFEADNQMVIAPISRPKGMDSDKRSDSEIRSSAIRGWATSKTRLGTSDQQRSDAQSLGWVNDEIEVRLCTSAELRATQMSSQIGADGGLLVRPGIPQSLEEALSWYGGMREVAEIIRTEGGETLPFPTDDDTSNTGSWVGENKTISAATVPTVGTTNLGAYELSSNIFKVPYALLDDSYINIDAYIGNKAGVRIARAGNTAYTVGDGANEATGMMLDTTLGDTAASSTTVTFDELKDLLQSVDKAYRTGGTWMMSDATFFAIGKLKDGDGNYLWQPRVTEMTPEMLLGYRVVINNDMPAMTSALKPIAFGAMNSYKIREAGVVRFQRLVELYAAQSQVGFLAVQRADGKLVDAGQNPVKHMLMA